MSWNRVNSSFKMRRTWNTTLFIFTGCSATRSKYSNANCSLLGLLSVVVLVSGAVGDRANSAGSSWRMPNMKRAVSEQVLEGTSGRCERTSSPSADMMPSAPVTARLACTSWAVMTLPLATIVTCGSARFTAAIYRHAGGVGCERSE
jgi:hypothetical protein